MLLKNNYSDKVYFFLLLVFQMGCRDRTFSQNKAADRSSIINCYITKPVRHDSKADTLRNFELTNETLDKALRKIIASKERIVYDSAMDYVTSFERQKLIFINTQCVSKLNTPDSCNLMDLYFNSGYRTKLMTRPIVEFVQFFKKNIYKFGNALVYEYALKGVAEVEPHFMYIILKEQPEDAQRYGEDYKGFVIYCDGIGWKDDAGGNFSIPLLKHSVRRDKQLYIPLFYDSEKFVPVGHFKSDNWRE
jgi:hypothetical protein